MAAKVLVGVLGAGLRGGRICQQGGKPGADRISTGIGQEDRVVLPGQQLSGARRAGRHDGAAAGCRLQQRGREPLGILGGQAVGIRLCQQLKDRIVRQRAQRMDPAPQCGQRSLLRAGARHSQRAPRQGLHSLGKAQRTLFGDEPPDKRNELSIRRQVQLFAPVYGIFCMGQPVQLNGVYSVRQAASRPDAEGLQPTADIPGHAVEGEPAAADAAAGKMLIHPAQRPGQPAVHHIAGRVVDDQRRDAAPLALVRSPDALGVHAGLNDRKVDVLRPQRIGGGKGLQHREAPAHDRP